MDLQIEGKHALVSGGAGGLGKAIARQLLNEGAVVTITDVDEQGLAETFDALKKMGQLGSISADLTSSSAGKNVSDFCSDFSGAPQIFVSAAGITGAKGHPLELADDDYEKTWHTNFLSAVRLSRAILPPMAETGWGRVIFVSSENAVQPYWDEAVSNTAKAALMNFAKGVSRQYAQHSVLVNTVAPAFIETPMTDMMMRKRAEERGEPLKEAVESFLDEERSYLELKRRGRPEEVAAAVAFLASGPASFINGANLRVDGGAVATVAQ